MVIADSNSILVFEYYDKPKRMEKWRKKLLDNLGYFSISEGFNKIIDTAGIWIEKYFSGLFDELPELPVRMIGSKFEKEVWLEMLNIKPGKTISYGKLAENIGRPRAYRAVGGASNRNSISLLIPCHRVVGAAQRLIGYGGGIERKKWLIDFEASENAKS